MSTEQLAQPPLRCPYEQTAAPYDPAAVQYDRLSARAAVLLAREVVAGDQTPHDIVEPGHIEATLAAAAGDCGMACEELPTGVYLKVPRYALQAVAVHLGMGTGIIAGRGAESRFTVQPAIGPEDIAREVPMSVEVNDLTTVVMRAEILQMFEAGYQKVLDTPELLAMAQCVEFEHTPILMNDPSRLGTKIPNTLAHSITNGGEFRFEMVGFVRQEARRFLSTPHGENASPEELRDFLHYQCKRVIGVSAMRVEAFIARDNLWGQRFDHEGKGLGLNKVEPLGPRIACPANFRLVRDPVTGEWQPGIVDRAAHAAINYLYDSGRLVEAANWDDWPADHPYIALRRERHSELEGLRAVMTEQIIAARQGTYEPPIVFQNVRPSACAHKRHVSGSAQ